MDLDTSLHEFGEGPLEHERGRIVILIFHNIPYHIFNRDDLVIRQSSFYSGSVKEIIWIARLSDFVFVENGVLFLEVGRVFGFVQELFHRPTIKWQDRAHVDKFHLQERLVKYRGVWLVLHKGEDVRKGSAVLDTLEKQELSQGDFEDPYFEYGVEFRLVAEALFVDFPVLLLDWDFFVVACEVEQHTILAVNLQVVDRLEGMQHDHLVSAPSFGLDLPLINAT